MGTRYGLRAGGKCETNKWKKKIDGNGQLNLFPYFTTFVACSKYVLNMHEGKVLTFCR